VLVSSHILTELEEIADRVVFVAGGRTKGEHEIRELVRGTATGWRIRATDPVALHAALDRHEVAAGLAGGGDTQLPPMAEEEAADLLAALIGDGVRVVEFAPVGSQLESAYLAMSQERR
jgi:ABC-2 type transport system ATP-binding protein